MFAEGQVQAARAFYYVCNFKDKPWEVGSGKSQPDLSPREFMFSVRTIINHLKDCIKSYEKVLKKLECVRESVRQHIQEVDDAEYEEEVRRLKSEATVQYDDGASSPTLEITMGPLPEKSPS